VTMTRPAISLEPQSHYSKVGEVTTRYVIAGQARTKPPILLMHGIGRTLEDWSANLQALSSERQVYALDLVGFGRTDKPNITYTLDDLRDFCLRFMDTLGIKKAVVGGNSLGGATALHIALSQPERVKGLILTAPAGCGKRLNATLQLSSLPLVGEFMERPRTTMNDERRLAIVRLILETCFYNKNWVTREQLEHDYALSLLPNTGQAFLTTLRAMCTWRGVKEQFLAKVLEKLPQVQAPTLVVWGKQDKVLPVVYAENTKRIPDSSVHLFDNCGHFPQLECAETFNKLVTTFLQEQKL
jgi:pimeloyl-ACP methyl ester carboxylesterase